MLSRKIRIIVIAGTGVAALSLPGAAAAMPLRSSVTVTPVRVAAPVTTARTAEVGSAGVPGYGDQKCEDLTTKAANLQEAGARATVSPGM